VSSSKSSFFQKLGPGLLYAGAAIGVSHLVQSTRAGAMYGIGMIAVVVLANFFKYPFFQYGPLYFAATGKSLVYGYREIGKWALWIFLLLTLGTMFIILAAIVLVTAGLATHVFPSSLPLWMYIIILLVLGMGLLIGGKIEFFNRFMKIIMMVLAITTVVAGISSIYANPSFAFSSVSLDLTNREYLFFLIAFIGWMPAPIDISVWYSIWAEARYQETGIKESFTTSQFDFRIGYWGTAFLALCFVLLGSQILFNSGIELSSNSVVFSGQIIEIYTTSIGNWAKPIITIAAFTTMFSTTITVMDGISRSLIPTTQLALPNLRHFSPRFMYKFWLMILLFGTSLLIFKMGENMKTMVDFATTLSFLTAPILAYFNIRVMNSRGISDEFTPSRFTQTVSYIGLVLLVGFTVLYFTLRWNS
jgi:Mn2+/Fe2+ NRAMP family transporter